MQLKGLIRRVRGDGAAVAPFVSPEPCTATCLGHALMAYWISGKSWDSMDLLRFMIRDEHLPAYAHAARGALQIVEASATTQDKDFWREIGRLKRRLDRYEEASEGVPMS